ncbi:scarecrow-like protein 34 isoform X1 [Syzygium oleosum]|uniref:scarecrow-like protein 34 isoform X1 n=2 Tax=Syzygium oleosum TaxID=219896 RepID=UPI0011D1F37F|nr:scarecrow-like protein 34 isoform X1 [Syzygium oleosum]XP_056165026.1 scarecrow-like protein 34 isoform X1 [Syzygium oleosum]
MESKFPEFTSPVDGFKDDSLTHPAISYHSRNLCNAVIINEPPVISNSAEMISLPHQPEPIYYVPSVPINLDGDLNLPSTDTRPNLGMLQHSTSSSDSPNKGGESLSLSDHSNSTDPVLKYINQMLMEENMEEQPWFVPNIVALRHTEKSLYDALGKKYPDSPEQTEQADTNQVINSSSCNPWGSSGDQGSKGTTSTSFNSFHPLDPNSHDDPEGNDDASIHANSPGDVVLQPNMDRNIQSYINSVNSLPNYGDKFCYSVPRELLIRHVFNSNESVLEFNKGLEEARKFIPSSIHRTINQEKDGLAPTIREKEEIGIDGSNQSEIGSRGRKNHERHYARFEEGRANKQLASYSEDSELSDLLEKLLLSNKNGGLLSLECKSEKSSEIKDRHDPNGIGFRSKKKGNESASDFGNLLTLCAQAVSTNDFKTARELLRQIRQDSSPSSDGSRRVAHYFANALEARLAGSAGRSRAFYYSVIQKRSVADKLRAYQLHHSACAFPKFSILFSNYMILKAAETATVLHIIDFGINFGFQWPILIQQLSKRTGGVPKLRITGIELPQPGFRPYERIDETGCRLTKYCERFHVPFEFQAVASASWECIKVADLNIRSDEVVAVNCLARFEHLYEETVEVNCQRDMVLNLIRSMKPHVFIHGIRNGSHNAPFFVTRFREALFHFSTIYDMFDTTVVHDNVQRLVLERDFFGREIMNIVACEGMERVERPETYKQWQVRLTRVGFQQLPLDQEFIKKARAKLSGDYHKDFMLDEENNWMLIGWRGRIISGCTCWSLA